MDSRRFPKIFVRPNATIREAIESIDGGAIEIALAVDEHQRLLGTISDGDIRRALLGGAELDASIAEVIHHSPITAAVGTELDELLRLMTEHGVEQIPLLEDGRVVDVAFIRDLVHAHRREHPVVIMAGGEGKRLRPLTNDTPKPMLNVGGRPLLETVLDQVRDAGFSRVLMAVNYQAEAIEEHFGDGGRFGIDIDYIREPTQLGSAGALRVAREQLAQPFIVINADLLTNVNLSALMRFHAEDDNLITVGVRRYVLEVPYGVVELEETRVTQLREKPTIDFFVSAGIYAVSPGAVALMPPEKGQFDMTDLIQQSLARGGRVGAFPIREYWLDIGQIADYERALDEHTTYFSST
jgi:dTDP-glucose pyrophosphorylase/predicted transcriptional regulator